MFETISFYVFAALTTAFFLIAVTTKQILYALSALAAGMILISGLFFTLHADFLGVVQIVVYGGAVMALYAFGMMFFDSAKLVQERVRHPRKIVLLSIAAALIVVLMLAAPIVVQKAGIDTANTLALQNPQAVGIVLFTKYLVPFEMASLMLLVALVAGIVLAGKKMDSSLTTQDDEDAQSHLPHFETFHVETKGGEKV